MQSASSINLNKALFIACGLALVLLITVILPAEYNIDPTGIGDKLGVTVFNPEQNEISAVTKNGDVSINNHQIEVVVPAGRGVEYKFQMPQFAKMTYEWETDQGELYFDLHGEPEGDTTGYFESYAITTSTNMKGSYTTPFTGSHGWYWKNKNEFPVTVYLVVEGEFDVIGLKQ